VRLPAADREPRQSFFVDSRPETGFCTLLVFFKEHQVTGQRMDTGRQALGEDAGSTAAVLRYFRVFNAEQADNLPQKLHPELGTFAQNHGAPGCPGRLPAWRPTTGACGQ
jgi:hypothetical protein